VDGDLSPNFDENMTPKTRDRSLGDGVYFAANDYIGLGPRIVAFVVDSLVLGTIFWIVSVLGVYAIDEFDDRIIFLCLIIAWLYLVPLKRSNFRTIGYRVIGCRLVTLNSSPLGNLWHYASNTCEPNPCPADNTLHFDRLCANVEADRARNRTGSNINIAEP
jgi:RDD family protein